ncbi:glutathione S-transferase [Sulfitobacter sp. EhC04]|uniref:glutathione S-transferase family protein n=1 Tax=Sulfitobacter sp. EhC04 TaxID=1849168 RepID=UPI0007F40BE5|nr:glutathione S-transferase family protein [Sulfitobacter sp. EhC04]OAN75641.1 glutathione S-transferase [Sulfitobacter sp. EhC04]
MARILWGVGTVRTMRAHWALQELELEYETRPILPRTGETQTPEYTALNPRQKIPLLQDGNFTLGESAAIITYLAETYTSGATCLRPIETDARFRWLEWSFFTVTELDSTSLYVMRRHGVIEGLSHLYGEAPDVVRRAGEYFSRQLNHASVALEDGRTYLMGDQFTTADILLTTCLSWACDYDIELNKRLHSYLDHNIERPAYKRADQLNRSRCP